MQQLGSMFEFIMTLCWHSLIDALVLQSGYQALVLRPQVTPSCTRTSLSIHFNAADGQSTAVGMVCLPVG